MSYTAANQKGSVGMVWSVAPDVWWIRMEVLEPVEVLEPEALVVWWSVGRTDSPGLSSPMLVPHQLLESQYLQLGRCCLGTWWRRWSIVLVTEPLIWPPLCPLQLPTPWKPLVAKWHLEAHSDGLTWMMLQTLIWVHVEEITDHDIQRQDKQDWV